jgi:hypothetical protein
LTGGQYLSDQISSSNREIAPIGGRSQLEEILHAAFLPTGVPNVLSRMVLGAPDSQVLALRLDVKVEAEPNIRSAAAKYVKELRISSVVECVAALEHNDAEIILVDDASPQPFLLPSNSARVIRHVRRIVIGTSDRLCLCGLLWVPVEPGNRNIALRLEIVQPPDH